MQTEEGDVIHVNIESFGYAIGAEVWNIRGIRWLSFFKMSTKIREDFYKRYHCLMSEGVIIGSNRN